MTPRGKAALPWKPPHLTSITHLLVGCSCLVDNACTHMYTTPDDLASCTSRSRSDTFGHTRSGWAVIYTSFYISFFLLRPGATSQLGLITSECCQLVEGLDQAKSSFKAVILFWKQIVPCTVTWGEKKKSLVSRYDFALKKRNNVGYNATQFFCKTWQHRKRPWSRKTHSGQL